MMIEWAYGHSAGSTWWILQELIRTLKWWAYALAPSVSSGLEHRLLGVVKLDTPPDRRLVAALY
jgi:hypothetical protein